MTEPPPGARTNALRAEHYVQIAGVNPRVVQALLESLEDAGVAAYAVPPELDRCPLYVDATQQELGSAVLGAELPGMVAELEPQTEADADAAFAAIIAGFDSQPADPVPPWPVSEDVTAEARAPRQDDDEPRPMHRLTSVPSDDEEDEHYVPPPPPPAPRVAPETLWAVVGLVVGLVIVIVLPLAGVEESRGTQLLGALGILGGLGGLVWRMRDSRASDDDPDDGAVI